MSTTPALIVLLPICPFHLSLPPNAVFWVTANLLYSPLQDVVTRGGKMVFLYSRPGQRVLVNSRGDLIVRPSWIEASLQRLPGGTA